MEHNKEEIEENIEEFKNIAFENFKEEKINDAIGQLNSLNCCVEAMIDTLEICKDYGFEIKCVMQRNLESDNFELTSKEVDIFKRNLKTLEIMITDITKL